MHDHAHIAFDSTDKYHTGICSLSVLSRIKPSVVLFINLISLTLSNIMAYNISHVKDSDLTSSMGSICT